MLPPYLEAPRGALSREGSRKARGGLLLHDDAAGEQSTGLQGTLPVKGALHRHHGPVLQEMGGQVPVAQQGFQVLQRGDVGLHPGDLGFPLPLSQDDGHAGLYLLALLQGDKADYAAAVLGDDAGGVHAHGQAGKQPPQKPRGQDGGRPRQHQPEAGADHGDHAVQLLGGRQLLQGIFSEQLGHARHSLSQIWATAHGLTIKSQKYTHISSKILR